MLAIRVAAAAVSSETVSEEDGLLTVRS